jgi:hypothetical protein
VALVTEQKEVEATEYERELTDEQLVGLAVHVGTRVTVVSAALAQLNPPQSLPMQQIENHHPIALLECFVGPEEALRVREFHLTWVDRMLDQVEAGLRMQAFAVLDGAS